MPAAAMWIVDGHYAQGRLILSLSKDEARTARSAAHPHTRSGIST